MKNEESLSKSANAALVKAQRLNVRIGARLEVLRKLKPDKGGYGDEMTKLRMDLAELNQRVHEYNAYINALTTD
jgi:hypothetical protein